MGVRVDVGELWWTVREELLGAYRDLVAFAVGIFDALLVVVAVLVVGRFVRRRVARGLARRAVNRNVATLAARGVTIGTYVVGVSLVLAVLGVGWTALGAVLGAGTVALSLALQDVLRSFVAGVYLLVERPFVIGDRVRVRDVEGTVEGIDLRTTAVLTAAGERVLVPNATVFGEIVTNRSAAGGERTTVTLKGVATAPSEVAGAVAEALAGVGELPARGPKVDLVAVGGEGLEATVEIGHRPGAEIAGEVLVRLRERFPEATVLVGRG